MKFRRCSKELHRELADIKSLMTLPFEHEGTPSWLIKHKTCRQEMMGNRWADTPHKPRSRCETSHRCTLLRHICVPIPECPAPLHSTDWSCFAPLAERPGSTCDGQLKGKASPQTTKDGERKDIENTSLFNPAGAAVVPGVHTYDDLQFDTLPGGVS